MVFFLCGVPGTGKTSIARILKDRYNVVELGEVIKAERLYTNFDEETGSFVIDEEAVRSKIKDLLKDDTIIEWIDLSFVDVQPTAAIVLRTNPLVLKKRLEERGYPPKKVKENVLAELLGVVHANIIKKWGDRVFDIDTSTGGPDQSARLFISVIEGRAKSQAIDWLTTLKPDELDVLIGQIDFHSVAEDDTP
ncbi:MAG: adenylate kinase family protein [Thermoprotei archaeon]|jgi:adenylate kinase